MVAIRPHRAATADYAIHRFRHPDRQTLAATRQPIVSIGLDEQVQVIGLDTGMNDPEPVVGGPGEGAAHGPEESGASQ